MNEHITFGAFLKSKRKTRGLTVRIMADSIGVGVGYYCDLESGRRRPPEKDMLDGLIHALSLFDEDTATFYDLAGRARDAAPPDLPEYINENAVVRVALRIAKQKASVADWQHFIDGLEVRYG